MHLETGFGHVGHLSGNTPALQHAGGLVHTVEHTFGVHTSHVIDIVSIRSLNEHIQRETLVREGVGESEREIRVRVTDIGAVGSRHHTVFVHVAVIQFTRFGIHAIGDISPETAERASRCVAHHILLDVVGGNGVVIYLSQAQTLQFVSVERDVEVGVPFEVLSNDVLGTYGEFKSLVHHLAAIVRQCVGSSRTTGQRDPHQHVLGSLVVVVGIKGEAVAQHGNVETDVRLSGRFPSQFRIGER